MSESLPKNPEKPNRSNQDAIERLTGSFIGMMVTENPFYTVCANVGIKDIESLKEKRVLDVAAGLSNFGVVAREQGIDVTSMDIGYSNVLHLYARSIETRQKYHGLKSEDTIEDMIKNPSNYVGGNALQMPIKDSRFDVIVCNSFLTSEPGMEPTLVGLVVSEGYRVLKPGGEDVYRYEFIADRRKTRRIKS
ncbi:methyltransferase domain-containing protein [Candidatus Saccharibacteria bacterium]|nr:methyltransferase domain-containing protein [Candidatus Saccharibacteria bacterium]